MRYLLPTLIVMLTLNACRTQDTSGVKDLHMSPTSSNTSYLLRIHAVTPYYDLPKRSETVADDRIDPSKVGGPVRLYKCKETYTDGSCKSEIYQEKIAELTYTDFLKRLFEESIAYCFDSEEARKYLLPAASAKLEENLPKINRLVNKIKDQNKSSASERKAMSIELLHILKAVANSSTNYTNNSTGNCPAQRGLDEPSQRVEDKVMNVVLASQDGRTLVDQGQVEYYLVKKIFPEMK